MSDKIKTCKPSLITAKADFKYRFNFIDQTKAEWNFELHTLSARQRGAVQASYVVVKLDNEGKPQREIDSNMELFFTATIYNALDSWNLDEPITVDNIDLLPSDVRNALFMAITAHETNNDETLEAELKN